MFAVKTQGTERCTLPEASVTRLSHRLAFGFWDLGFLDKLRKHFTRKIEFRVVFERHLSRF